MSHKGLYNLQMKVSSGTVQLVYMGFSTLPESEKFWRKYREPPAIHSLIFWKSSAEWSSLTTVVQEFIGNSPLFKNSILSRMFSIWRDDTPATAGYRSSHAFMSMAT